MPTTTQEPGNALLTNSGAARANPSAESEPTTVRGFGSSAAKGNKRNRARKRSSGLSKTDWGPLGKHPDLDAIVARQRLQLPLSGRLTSAQVNQAWKRNAAEHHPDRGGAHDTMQLVNAARDLLLGRGLATGGEADCSR